MLKETAPTTAQIIRQPNAASTIAPTQTAPAQHTALDTIGTSLFGTEALVPHHFLHQKDLLTLEFPLLGTDVSLGPSVPEQLFSPIAPSFLSDEDEEVEGVFSPHHSSPIRTPLAAGPLRSQFTYGTIHDLS